MSKIPKLRFKEFSGEWESKKLGELLEFKNGINASKEQYGHGKKFINVLDILNNDYITHENIIGKVDIDDDTFEKYSVGYGDVVFQRSSETREEVGTANIYLDKEHKATFGGFIIRGKKVGEYSPIFMNKLLKTSSSRKEITSKSGGSTRYNVGQETLSEVSLLFPKLEEQEKIASFFSLIDDKISLQSGKIEALKDYKKGMMQKIFTRELRFKDDEGRDYPEWEEKKLGECIENKGGTALEKFVDKNGTHKFISIGNYSTDGKYIDTGQRISLNEKTKDKLLYKGDLVMVLNDKTSTGDLIGSTILIDEDDTYIYNQRSERLICNENIHSNFAWIILNYEGFRKRVFSIAQGGTQIYVNFSSLKELKIELPRLKEQCKISKFILSIDAKLEREQEKLDSLNEYKKGLLQQMFV